MFPSKYRNFILYLLILFSQILDHFGGTKDLNLISSVTKNRSRKLNIPLQTYQYEHFVFQMALYDVLE